MGNIQTITINYFLIVAAGIQIILIWLLTKQKEKSFYTTTFIYITLLFLIETIASIFLFNSSSIELSSIVSKIRFISECFILAAIFSFNQYFRFSDIPPKFSIKNLFPYITAFILSAAALFNFIIDSIQKSNGVYFPNYSSYYWIMIVFFVLILSLILFDLVKKYKFSRHTDEYFQIKEIIWLVLLSFISLFTLYILPFGGIFHPIYFLGYFLIAAFIFYSSFRFHFLKINEYTLHLIPQIGISSLFLIIFFFLKNDSLHLDFVLLSVPLFLILTLGGNYILIYFKKFFQNLQREHNEHLDLKIEKFTTSITKIIDITQLWEYLASFIKSNFEFNKIAIVSLQYDISPYRIEFLEEYSTDKIQKLLSEPNSLIFEQIEDSQTILNRFDYPTESILYKKMNEYQIYLGIPLVKNDEVLAIVFLGGNQHKTRIPQQYLSILNQICSHTANAIDNIQTIQDKFQEKKMADLGMLTSQLAHDFQSFISIVKLENPDNKRLTEHANYTEKLVGDLLNYARPQELKFIPVNINHLIDMSFDLVDLPTDIQIEKHFSPDLPEINVDMGQIRRVFTNLFENSIRAMESANRKRLKITTKQLRPLSKTQRNPWVYIEILDDGNGIPEENLDKIFEPFYTTYKNKGGNGMGLAIVKQIITRHKGTIDVTSRPNKGTIFNIRLPYLIF